MRYKLPHLAALVMVLSIAGCAALVEPQNFDEKLAYAYSSHTAVLDATTNSLDLGDISSAEAEHILQLADRSRLILDGARVASGSGDVTTAEGQLVLATNILTELQTYLRSRTAP